MLPSGQAAGKPEPVPVPSELLAVPRPVLEVGWGASPSRREARSGAQPRTDAHGPARWPDHAQEYVHLRLRQFSRVFGGLLSPTAPPQQVEQAYASSLQFLAPGESSTLDNCTIKFRHRCRRAPGGEHSMGGAPAWTQQQLGGVPPTPSAGDRASAARSSGCPRFAGSSAAPTESARCARITPTNAAARTTTSTSATRTGRCCAPSARPTSSSSSPTRSRASGRTCRASSCRYAQASRDACAPHKQQARQAASAGQRREGAQAAGASRQIPQRSAPVATALCISMRVPAQLCVIDGESWSESTPHVTHNVKRLLRSDEVRLGPVGRGRGRCVSPVWRGTCVSPVTAGANTPPARAGGAQGEFLISSLGSGTKVDQEGFLYLKLQVRTLLRKEGGRGAKQQLPGTQQSRSICSSVCAGIAGAGRARAAARRQHH